MKTLWPLSLLAFALVACEPSTGPSELDIVRGRTVPASSPAFLNTVRVEAHFSSCSASIIGEKLILTAAHCVEDSTASQIKVIFERKDSVPAVERKIDVSRVQMFKKEGAAFFPNFDMAWLELKETIPAPFQPMEVLRDPSLLTPETSIILAGYGMQKDDCSDTVNCSGVLREGNTQLSTYHDEAHIMSLLVFHGDPQKNLSGACYGDSGGPAYAQIQGQWYVVGVTNGFTDALAPQSDGSCEAGWDIYTFAGDYVPWLEMTSGYHLKVGDSARNRTRASPPKLISGLSLPRPASWSEWVSYANHEDPAWSTMDAILQSMAYNYRSLGVTREQMTEVLYNPELTRPSLETRDFLWIYGTLSDLAPLQYFTGLQSLSVNTPSLDRISALDALPKLTSLSFQNVQSVPHDLLDQVPQLKTRLHVLGFENMSESALARVDWKNLNQLKALKLRNSTLNVSRFNQLNLGPDAELELDQMIIKGSFAPQTMPGTLRLS
nr:trypsin-like serine protease [Pseudobdellovibrionaceae bacterium]